MSVLGLYFVNGLMRATGWPKKQGFLGKQVIDVLVLDSAIDEMINWGAGLGAGRPKRALQIYVAIGLDRGWDVEHPPSIEKFIDAFKKDNEIWRSPDGVAPRDVVNPYRFATDSGSTVNAKVLTNHSANLEAWLLQSLLWGFENPGAFEAWYRNRFDPKISDLMRGGGIDLGPQPDLPQYLANGEEALRNYERKVQLLPEVPEMMLADAKAYRRKRGTAGPASQIPKDDLD
jgi:hypothetical protein